MRVQAEGKRDAQAAAPEPASKKQRAADDADNDDERCTAATEKQAKSPDGEALAPTDCSSFRDYGNDGQRTEWESVVQQ